MQVEANLDAGLETAFAACLVAQMEKHPSVQPQDIVKLCYQAAYGAEHLLSDLDAAWAYLKKEYEAVAAATATDTDAELWEDISPYVCRVNLAAWKAKGLPLQWLFQMFVASASVKSAGGVTSAGDAKIVGVDLLSDYLSVAGKILPTQSVSFSMSEWQRYLAEYQGLGMPAVHHSPQYREHERPAYRIVDRQYMHMLGMLRF